ncbi:MAG: zinc-ribbon domain-containing protein, partial [Terriglobales bacterium]
MFCNHCGQRLAAAAMVCQQCGHPAPAAAGTAAP